MGDGYWPSRWPAEDGGARRTAIPRSGAGLGLRPGEQLVTTAREAIVATMVVLRDPGEAYVLRHTGGEGSICWVEQFDPVTLEVIRRSPDLPGGKTWPGGVAAHANGSIYTTFGRYAHRLDAELAVIAQRELPRDRPYNSFVVLPDGCIATKDFAGALPGGIESAYEGASELVVLEPDRLEIVGRCQLPEPSIARLSADGDTVYVVGDTHLFRLRWDGRELQFDDGFRARYRTQEGQTYGWDAVIAGGAAWFLDDGFGSEGYAGTFRGRGVSSAPLHLVRVDLSTAAVTLTEICGLPNGIVANPPAIDIDRRIAVGYDSSNAVLAAFDIGLDGTLTSRWQRQQDHACHPIVFTDTGELVTADHDAERFADAIVVLDIETGEERGRVDVGSPLQSVVFLAPGFGRDLYYCSFSTLARISVAGPS